MIKESTLYKWIRDLPKEVGHKLFFQRLESHGTNNGIPDVYYCYNGLTGFIELKSWNKLSPSQKLWGRRYVRSGGILFLMYIEKDTNCKILKHYTYSDLIDGSPADFGKLYVLTKPIDLLGYIVYTHEGHLGSFEE